VAKRKTLPALPDGQRVLTLDIASAVGWAFGAGGRVIGYGKYVGDNSDEHGERLVKLSKWLSKTIHSLPAPPDLILIEPPYLGRNTKTFAVLNKYLGVVQREVYRITEKECTFMSSKEVKSILKLPKSRNHDQQKRNMVRLANQLLGTEFKFVNNRSTKSKKSDDDIADAIGLLIAWWIKNGIIESAESVGLV
jgi:Holliday junction resolvasome RuvABC endonuclease subunit